MPTQDREHLPADRESRSAPVIPDLPRLDGQREAQAGNERLGPVERPAQDHAGPQVAAQPGHAEERLCREGEYRDERPLDAIEPR